MEIKEELTLVVFEVQTSTVNNRKFEVEKTKKLSLSF
jgi:hypothetical protein